MNLGIAYHGNRILRHVEEDMRDMVAHNFNLVVHMFSHNDWDRHFKIMKEIVDITKGYGLDVWIDNWGLGGPPGDKSHFLAYQPSSHQIYSNGEMEPVRACLNSPEFRKFTKDWIDAVEEIGGQTIFWDEPHLVGEDIVDGKPTKWTCRCERCMALFKEKYGHEMPELFTPEVEQFRLWTIGDYFRDVTTYSKEKGMNNVICVMLGDGYGINLETLDTICDIPSLDNIGSDPYWYYKTEGPENAYKFVYEGTKRNLEVCERYGKDHNIWIQGYGVPAGREEEIIYACHAAYDAGARNILVWSNRAGESNDYRAENADLTWKIVGDAMFSLAQRDREEKLNEYRKLIK